MKAGGGPAPAGHQALAFVALGSNLGNSRDLIKRALDRLQNFSAAPLRKSSLWLSSPVDCPPDSPLFVNAVAGLTPRLDETPESLLSKLQTLEVELGRRPKKVLNEPRSLDLDLIAFGGVVCHTPRLILPHPRAHLRRFVLQPLGEIAADCVLPLQKKTVAQLLGEMPETETLVRLGLSE